MPRLEILVYKHAVYDEYVLCKAIRSVSVDVKITSVRLREMELSFRPTVSLGIVGNGPFGGFATKRMTMPSHTTLGTVLDHVLLMLRQDGFFTEAELCATFHLWTLTSTLGATTSTSIMYAAKGHTLASKVPLDMVQDSSVQLAKRRRRDQ